MSEEIWYYYNDRASPAISGVSDLWKSILLYGIDIATHFEAHFPVSGHSDLTGGRDEFLKLPNISVKPWSGMRGAIAVHGEMTREARVLFTEAAEEESLWDYYLFRGGKEFISVSDHHDCLVSQQFLMEYLENLFGRFQPFRYNKTQTKQGSKDALLTLLQEITMKALFGLKQETSTKEKP